MRILILHSRYQSGPISGENRVVDDEARLLEAAGHAVRTWTPSARDFDGSSVRAGLAAVWAPAAVRSLRAAARTRTPEVVHVHNLFPSLSPAVLRAARDEGIPAVLTLHNFRLLCLPATFLRDGRVCADCLGRLPWRGVAHGCYRGSRIASLPYFASISLHRAIGTVPGMVPNFIAVSRFIRDKHVEAGFPPERITVKPNFAWPAPRRAGAGEHFLFLGRLSPEKGLDVLLRAWRPSLGQLVVAGDGPGASLLRPPPPGVEFRGAVRGEQVLELLRGARAVIVPSVSYEAFPRAVVEAYAQGVPVVASRLGALEEVVRDDVSGLLAEPDDAGSLAEAMGRLLHDHESERLGEGAYRLWAERYTPQENLRQLESIYADAIAATASDVGRGSRSR